MSSVIVLSNQGAAEQPSPSVWADCRNTLLQDLGLGYFAHEEFRGNIEVASFADATVFGSGTLDVDADTGALAPVTGVAGGVAKFTTGASDNDAIALFGPPLGAIVRNSGNPMWFETRIQAVTLFDGGIFVGLGGESSIVRDVIADNPSTSAVAALLAQTLIGFVTVESSSAIKTLNIVYSKGSGTPVTVLTDALASSAIPTAAVLALTAATFVKLGIRFDGGKFLYFYVNGYQVARVEVDSTVDQTSLMTAVINVKTGTAVAKAIALDWARYAFQSRS